MLAIAVLTHNGANRIESDVDAAGFFDDAIDVFLDGGIVERINHRHVRTAAVCRDLPGHVFHVGLGPAG